MKRALFLVCVVALVAAGFVWHSVPHPVRGASPAGNGDVNGDADIDLSDAIYLLTWLFQGGPEPIAIAGSPELEQRVAGLESKLGDIERQIALGASPAEMAYRRSIALLGEDPNTALPLEKILGLWTAGEAAALPVSLAIDGQNAGDVMAFVGHEQISSPSRFDVLVRTAGAGSSPPGGLGSAARLAFAPSTAASSALMFDGFETATSLVAADATSAWHVVRIESPIARLRLNVRSRVFSGATATEIAGRLLDGIDHPQAEMRLVSPPPVREYCVQYLESDFDFASRLMEEEGISYFYRQGADGHVLVLGDSAQAYETGPAVLPYTPTDAPADPSRLSVFEFRLSAAQQVAKVTVRGWDPKKKESIVGTAQAAGLGELYEFGLDNPTAAEASRIARLRLAELSAQSQQATGVSNVPGFRPGHVVAIQGAGSDRFNGKYLVQGVTHRFHRYSDGNAVRLAYGNQFTCIPDSVAYRPRRVTPKPIVPGTETALVVGPPGEEIYTDQYGRVKVQFHWDRSDGANPESSAWLRVASPAAGAGRGFFMLPEVDDEVLVAFEHGDPDRPVVIGSLWNGVDKPPSVLPQGAARSLLRSRGQEGHAGGGGANEIILDDTPGKEGVAVRGGSIALGAPETVVEGRLASLRDAGIAQRVAVGERFRDNSIVAWARVGADGNAGAGAFGVLKASRLAPGEYLITLSAQARSPEELAPTATCLTPRAPGVPQALRIASVNVEGPNLVHIFISDGDGRPVDGEFVFLATGR